MDRGTMRYAAFDIGNVIVRADFNFFIGELSKQFNMSLEDAKYFMNRSQKLHDLGLTTMKDELRNNLNVKSEPLANGLVNVWNYCINPELFIVDRIHHLMKTENLQVALLSNIGLEHSKRMPIILNRYGFFDKCVKYFSCHVGARKPSSLYYQSFLQLHPEWKGCVYVDDLQENLDASKPFGFQTFHFSLEDSCPEKSWRGTVPDKWLQIEEAILAESPKE